jgi:hypothetical protein
MRLSFDRATLGSTGLEVGRLGISASYGVPTAAVERAFEQGVNYIYWGSRRTEQFAQALRNLAGQRDRMVLLIQSYCWTPRARRNVDVCLTGRSTAQHVDEALEGLRRGPMTAEDLEWMRRVGRAVYGK